MKYTKVFLFGICIMVMFQACNKVTYPKNKIAESVEALVKKEYNLDSKAKLIGGTLYLNVKLSGLTTTEQKALGEVFQKVQGAALAITRVALSSDAKIVFLVLTATDSSWKLNVRIIERMEDIKKYFYQRISRADYEERLIFEIETDENGSVVPYFFEQQKELNMKEFLGRLIVAQINMLSRSNPFLSTMLGNSQLKYDNFINDEIKIKLSNTLSPAALPLFEDIVKKQSIKIVKKYNEWQPKSIEIVGQNDQKILINIPSNLAASH